MKMSRSFSRASLPPFSLPSFLLRCCLPQARPLIPFSHFPTFPTPFGSFAYDSHAAEASFWDDFLEIAKQEAEHFLSWAIRLEEGYGLRYVPPFFLSFSPPLSTVFRSSFLAFYAIQAVSSLHILPPFPLSLPLPWQLRLPVRHRHSLGVRRGQQRRRDGPPLFNQSSPRSKGLGHVRAHVTGTCIPSSPPSFLPSLRGHGAPPSASSHPNNTKSARLVLTSNKHVSFLSLPPSFPLSFSSVPSLLSFLVLPRTTAHRPLRWEDD